jgi:prevent-host-death family protein
MTELTQITAREANQRFSEVLAKVERGGQGFVVTKHGRPVARILPFGAEGTSEDGTKEVILRRLFASAKPLGVGPVSRDELHERR